jgi:phosphoribosylamine-glycine ligase
MLTPTGPQVIEYNCRFGDPECQAVMPLVKGDLAGFCLAGAKGELRSDLISFDDGWSVCVILASAGYPESSHNGDLITGLGNAKDFRVYHAGTHKTIDDDWETYGGRVLAVVAGAATRMEAVTKAHAAADLIHFPGLQRRRDIGILNFD